MARSQHRPGDESTLADEGWVEYGGELIWAVGFTPDGVPYGSTYDEVRRLDARASSRADWARARALLSWAFEACSPPGTKGSLKGCYGIRINDQRRVVFQWTENGPSRVRVTDYH